MNASHIMCAYGILDLSVVHMQDCLDGNETGSGRHLLQMLIDNSYKNIAIFMARHHKGPNIGLI